MWLSNILWKVPAKNDEKTSNYNEPIRNVTNGVVQEKGNKIIKNNNALKIRSDEYGNTIIQTQDNKTSKNHNTFSKLCSLIFPCYKLNKKYCCASTKLGFRKCYYYE